MTGKFKQSSSFATASSSDGLKTSGNAVLPIDTDRYGRTVAEVTLPDGRNPNRELVGQGMAWWYTTYAPADRESERAEAAAKAAKLGLWADPSPVPPWDWRKGQGVPATDQVVGNKRSHVHHRPTCRGVAGMSEKNCVEFKTAAEAEGAGYRKVGDCWK